MLEERLRTSPLRMLADGTCVPAVLCILLFLSGLGTGFAAGVRKISDSRITAAIDGEQLIDSSVPSHLINVSPNRGIVTLSGSVENSLAKDRAERIAEATQGVRTVVNRVQVNPMQISDNRLRDDILSAVGVHAAADSYEVDNNLRVRNAYDHTVPH